MGRIGGVRIVRLRVRIEGLRFGLGVHRRRGVRVVRLQLGGLRVRIPGSLGRSGRRAVTFSDPRWPKKVWGVRIPGGLCVRVVGLRVRIPGSLGVRVVGLGVRIPGRLGVNVVVRLRLRSERRRVEERLGRRRRPRRPLTGFWAKGAYRESFIVGRGLGVGRLGGGLGASGGGRFRRPAGRSESRKFAAAAFTSNPGLFPLRARAGLRADDVAEAREAAPPLPASGPRRAASRRGTGTPSSRCADWTCRAPPEGREASSGDAGTADDTPGAWGEKGEGP